MMLSQLKKKYRQLIPEWFREWIIKIIIIPAKKINVVYLWKSKKIKQEIIRYYEQDVAMSEEQRAVVDFLKENPLSMFPLKFPEVGMCQVYNDPERDLRYVLFYGKRLYMKRTMTRLEIQRSYQNLICEQSSNSPHCYFTDDFFVENGDVVIDAGTAEGNFALTIIEKVKKIYLFETDPEWIESLEATFEPWKDKVVVFNKFISDNDEGQNISLDTVLGDDDPVSFIKADIEGAEIEMLRGMEKILSRKSDMKLVLCTYHHQSDEENLTNMLVQKGFSVQPSAGYMILFDDPEFQPPYLRRGLIRARKCIK